MTGKQYGMCWILAGSLIGSWALPAAAVEAVTDPLDQEVSAYQNPAQAAHAANLAEAAAMTSSEELDAAKQGVVDAENDLLEAVKTGDTGLVEAAELALEEAELALADTVSQLTGAAEEQILELRESGMGWGQIAHELGVHPSALGLGRTKKGAGDWDLPASPSGSDAELEESTATDLSTGMAKGHGLGNGRGDSAGQGLGLSQGGKTKGNSDKAGSQVAAAAGNGRGQGNGVSPGNSGKGGDKGERGNKGGNGKGKNK